MYDLVLGHTSFMGHTGYANHAREFFTALNKFVPVGIVSTTVDDTTELSDEQQEMINRIIGSNVLHIVLEVTGHPVFYEDIPSPKIAYNVWESTRQPDEFFARLLEYDQLWVPSEWQRQCSIDQGYPEDRVKVIPEGVDGELFQPMNGRTDDFRFLLFGRWEYRKSTTEIIQAFLVEFERDTNVGMAISVDNSFSIDGFETTEERLEHHGLMSPKLEILHFPPRNTYADYLKYSDVFVSCSRAEGWNLPLIEAVACGLPSICSDFGGQLEYAGDLLGVHKVRIKEMKPPQETYPVGSQFPGMWAEPDFNHLREIMRSLYNQVRDPIDINRIQEALAASCEVRDRFSWESAAEKSFSVIKKFGDFDESTTEKETRLRTQSRIKWRGVETEMVPWNTTAGLFELADDYITKDTVMVELGCFGGVSTEVFASRAKKVYGVDEWQDCYGDITNILMAQARFEQMQYRAGNVEKIRSQSVPAAQRFEDSSLDLVYVDAAHDYDAVCADILAWMPKLKPKGIMCGHDYFHRNVNPGADGVRPAVDNTLGEYKLKHYSDSSWAVSLAEKHIVVIGAWCVSDAQEDLLHERVVKAKSLGFDVMLVSHKPIPSRLQQYVDYYVFDSHNPLMYKEDYYKISLDARLWIQSGGLRVDTEAPWLYDYAIWTNIRNALNTDIMKSKDYVHYIEYDVDIDNDVWLNTLIAPVVGNDLCYIKPNNHHVPYEEMESGVFSFSVKKGLEVFSEYKTPEEYYVGRLVATQLEYTLLEAFRKYDAVEVNTTRPKDWLAIDRWRAFGGSESAREVDTMVDVTYSIGANYVGAMVIGIDNRGAKRLDCVVEYSGERLELSVEPGSVGLEELQNKYQKGEVLTVSHNNKVCFRRMFDLPLFDFASQATFSRESDSGAKLLKVVTFANHTNSGLDRLVESVTAQGMELEVLGAGVEWGDFITKFIHMRDYVSTLPKKQLVLFLDGFDSYLLGNETELIQAYHRQADKNTSVYTKAVPESYIVVGAEKNLYPDRSLAENYPPGEEKFRYVNSGTYMGPAGVIYNALNTMVDKYTKLPEALLGTEGGLYGRNDQWLLTKYFMANGHKIIRDVDCEMFQTLGNTTKDEVNKQTLVWHGNGNGGELLDELVDDLNNQQKAAFVVTWLGPFPDWFYMFLCSCAENPEFDWLIFSDQQAPHEYPENVSFIDQTKLSFEQLASRTIDHKVRIGVSYKLCDYKPLYGHIYDGYLKDYDYWGFCDLDVIWGKLDGFFNKYMEQDYDVITFGGSTKDGLHYRVAGPCTLVHNTPKMRELYASTPGFQSMLDETDKYTNFDESMWSDKLIEEDVKLEIILNGQNFQHEKTQDNATWLDGKLTLVDNTEIGFFHMLTKDYVCEDIVGGFTIAKSLKPVFVLGGDSNYMPLIETCVSSLLKFSTAQIVVYGFGCDIPFDLPRMQKRRIDFTSKATLPDGRAVDSYFCKLLCGLDAIENVEGSHYAWIDGDSFCTESIDRIWDSVGRLNNYPLFASHIYDHVVVQTNGIPAPGFEELKTKFGISERSMSPWVQACMFLFDKNCKQFMLDVLKWKDELTPEELVEKSGPLGDEIFMNLMLWKYEATEQLGVHIYDIYWPKYFDKFFTAEWQESYSEYMPVLAGGLSEHIHIPEKSGVWLMHCQHDPKVLKEMYERYLVPTEKVELERTKYYLPNSTEPVDISVDGIDTFSGVYHEIFVDKTYEHGRCKIEPGDVVVDCGGNIGVFARYAKEMGASEVYSFEPEPDNYSALEKNVESWKSELGISNKAGISELFIHSCEGGHSVKDNNINNTKTGESVQIELVTLDHMIGELGLDVINYLKVDIEGSELDLFAGLSDDNLAKVQKICIEYHNMLFDFKAELRTELLTRLTNAGFSAYTLYLGDNDHIQMLYLCRSDNVDVTVHFVDGPYCEVQGPNGGQYKVDFVDSDIGRSMYGTILGSGEWARPGRKYCSNWLVRVTDTKTDKTLVSHRFDPIGQRVLIWMDSKSLGDTIAWFPYLEAFAKEHKCSIVTATWWNELFESVYPNIDFTKVGDVAPNIYASFGVGVFDGDSDKNKHPWNSVPLQQVGTDMLGLEYKELKPKISMSEYQHKLPKDYVCLSEHSTMQAKYWNYVGGWQEVVDYITSQGLEVLTIGKEGTELKNVTPIHTSPITQVADVLAKAKMFLGVGSGLSWLSWAVNTPVVMVSGFSEPFCEFQSGNHRIINKDVCHGCFNDSSVTFARDNWAWCPKNKDFECSKNIKPETVIKAVGEILTNIV